jgi:hypothetical protein
LAGLKNLAYLSLSATKVTHEGLKELIGLDKLLLLDLDDGQFTDATLRVLRKIGLLHTTCKAWKNGSDDPLDDHFWIRKMSWKEMSALRPASADEVMVFSLAFTPVTDAGLGELTAFRNLRSLSLNGSFITKNGLNELRGLKHLTALSLRGEVVTDDMLQELANLKGLSALGLGSAPLTDSSIKLLAGVKELTVLELSAAYGVTDRHLSELKSLKKLATLGLNRSRVSDHTLRTLREIGVLHSLSIARGTGKTRPISPADVISFDPGASAAKNRPSSRIRSNRGFMGTSKKKVREISVRPNAQDQLPGRLQRLQPTQNLDAGPVNCIQSFGPFFRISAFPWGGGYLPRL